MGPSNYAQHDDTRKTHSSYVRATAVPRDWVSIPYHAPLAASTPPLRDVRGAQFDSHLTRVSTLRVQLFVDPCAQPHPDDTDCER